MMVKKDEGGNGFLKKWVSRDKEGFKEKSVSILRN